MGPNTGRPASWKRSAIPAASGASGPTTVSPTWLYWARLNNPSTSSARIETLRASCSVPALPGATSSSVTLGLWLSFHAMACSLAPFPTTRTFSDPIPKLILGGVLPLKNRTEFGEGRVGTNSMRWRELDTLLKTFEPNSLDGQPLRQSLSNGSDTGESLTEPQRVRLGDKCGKTDGIITRASSRHLRQLRAEREAT